MYKEKINKIYSILPKILSNIAEWVVVLLTTIIMFFLCLVILKYKFNAENSVPEESIFLYNPVC